MSGDGEGLGLELRLPWGRPARLPDPDEADTLAAAPSAPVVPPPPEPAPAPPQAAVVAPPGWMVAPVPTAPAFDPAELQRSLETLLVVLEGRFDRIEERLVRAEAAAAPGTLDDAGTAPPPELVERLERTGREIEGRFDRLERLVVVSHQAAMDAVEVVARAEPAGERSGAPELLAAVERLEAQLAANHRSTLEAVAEQLPGLVDLERWLGLIDGALRERIDQVKSRIDSSHAAIMGAMSDLDPADRVTELAASIVATGESLDVELTELRRLLSQSAKSSN